MTAWTVGDFIEQLAASVAARGTITALTPVPAVLDYLPSAKEGHTDGIFIGYQADDNPEKVFVDSTQQRRDESNSVSGFVRVERVGSGGRVAKEVRDRALFLIGEVDDQLRNGHPNVGSQTISAAIDSRHFEGFPISDSGAARRVATIEFTIRYKARTL